jgi:quinol monooxygenase YgiN
MEIPSLAQLKKELAFLSEKELIELLAELAKFSRDNKAFLYFKLFENTQPNLYLNTVKEELEEAFQTANTKHYHLAKKSAQSIRRKLNKALKLSKNKADQAELILYYSEKLKDYGYLKFKHPVITNIFQMQLQKAEKLIEKLDEDLQYDLGVILDNLRS